MEHTVHDGAAFARWVRAISLASAEPSASLAHATPLPLSRLPALFSAANAPPIALTCVRTLLAGRVPASAPLLLGGGVSVGAARSDTALPLISLQELLSEASSGHVVRELFRSIAEESVNGFRVSAIAWERFERQFLGGGGGGGGVLLDGVSPLCVHASHGAAGLSLVHFQRALLSPSNRATMPTTSGAGAAAFCRLLRAGDTVPGALGREMGLLNHPLHHYYISCSHNSYLEGDQLAGIISVDICRRPLITLQLISTQ